MRSEWDVRFVQDMIGKLNQTAVPPSLSQKQMTQLERIWSRYSETSEADDVVNSFPYADHNGRSPYQR